MKGPQMKSLMKPLLTILFSLVASAAFSGDATVVVHDAYARAASPSAMAGAAFFHIENTGDHAVVLIGAETPAAARTELHTHREISEGVMQMVEIEGGITLAPGETRILERGGDHVMLMGLTNSLNDGDMLTLTLIFESADPAVVDIPVDLSR